MITKRLIRGSDILSKILMPFYVPTWAFLWLFFFSYLKMLDLGYKLYVLSLVIIFTILIPRFGINVFRRLNAWTHWELSARENRTLPYVLTICSYGSCLYLLSSINSATFMRGIILASLVSQLLCSVINLKWKISTHMMGIGGLLGIIIAFSYLFYYNPMWPVCLLLILSGLLGTSRMILRQHSLSQVFAGFAVGMLCAIIFILIRF